MPACGRASGMSGSAIRTQDGERILLSLLPPVELERVLREVLDEEAFLSPHGLRALSRRHRDQPFKVTVGGVTATSHGYGEEGHELAHGDSSWWDDGGGSSPCRVRMDNRQSHPLPVGHRHDVLAWSTRAQVAACVGAHVRLKMTRPLGMVFIWYLGLWA